MSFTKKDEYHGRYSFLKLVKFPNEIGAIPTFKEERIKLSRDETEFVLAALEEYRKESRS